MINNIFNDVFLKLTAPYFQKTIFTPNKIMITPNVRFNCSGESEIAILLPKKLPITKLRQSIPATLKSTAPVL